jgi:hypothetical protein
MGKTSFKIHVDGILLPIVIINNILPFVQPFTGANSAREQNPARQKGRSQVTRHRGGSSGRPRHALQARSGKKLPLNARKKTQNSILFRRPLVDNRSFAWYHKATESVKNG